MADEGDKVLKLVSTMVEQNAASNGRVEEAVKSLRMDVKELTVSYGELRNDLGKHEERWRQNSEDRRRYVDVEQPAYRAGIQEALSQADEAKKHAEKVRTDLEKFTTAETEAAKAAALKVRSDLEKDAAAGAAAHKTVESWKGSLKVIVPLLGAAQFIALALIVWALTTMAGRVTAAMDATANMNRSASAPYVAPATSGVDAEPMHLSGHGEHHPSP